MANNSQQTTDILKEVKLTLELHLLEEHGIYFTSYTNIEEMRHIHWLEHNDVAESIQ